MSSSAHSATSAASLSGRRWKRRDYSTDPSTLARTLLGRLLVRRLDSGEVLAGRIVETEAYLGVPDRAAHTFNGRRTERNSSMFERAGTLYVYFTYGMHHCLNIVCGGVGEPVAVLVRALEPVAGARAMSRQREAARKRPGPPIAGHKLCAGPARLCRALDIDRRLDGIDLVSDGRVWIAEPRRGAVPVEDGDVVRAPRIGVDYAGEWALRPLRWLIAGHRCVSVPAPGT